MTVEELGRKLIDLPGDLPVIMYCDWVDPVASVYIEKSAAGDRVVLDADPKGRGVPSASASSDRA